MKTVYLTAFAAAIALASPLQAEVTGGSIGLSHSAFTDDKSVSKTSLDGSVEYRFNQQFSMQGDLSLNEFNESNISLRNLTLHGIYHLSPSTSLGAFVGIDRISGESANLYGLEFGSDMGRTDLEGYVAIGEEEDVDATLLGLSGRYAYTDAVGFGASLDYGDIDGVVDFTRFGVSADYNVTETVNLSAELGEFDINAGGFGGSETYIKLGATVKFGAKRGTTFERRSLTSLFPGL